MPILHNAEETFVFGRGLAASVSDGMVLALTGGLGAGKTQFVKGLAAGMGVEMPVTSPTFTLVHEYPAAAGRTLYHIDFYRLDDAAEAIAIGLEECMGAGAITAIEWADKFPSLIPPGAVWLHFAILDGDQREIRFAPAIE